MTNADLAILLYLAAGIALGYAHRVKGWKRYTAWALLWFPAVVIEAVNWRMR